VDRSALDELGSPLKSLRAGFVNWRDCALKPDAVFASLRASKTRTEFLKQSYGIWGSAFTVATVLQFLNFHAVSLSFEGFIVSVILSSYLFAGIALLALLYALSLRVSRIRIAALDALAAFTVAMATIAPMASIVMLPFMHAALLSLREIATSHQALQAWILLGFRLLGYQYSPKGVTTDIWSSLDQFGRPLFEAVFYFGFFQLARLTARSVDANPIVVYLSTARFAAFSSLLLYLGFAGALGIFYFAIPH
jgi:hypothetical protein